MTQSFFLRILLQSTLLLLFHFYWGGGVMFAQMSNFFIRNDGQLPKAGGGTDATMSFYSANSPTDVFFSPTKIAFSVSHINLPPQSDTLQRIDFSFQNANVVTPQGVDFLWYHNWYLYFCGDGIDQVPEYHALQYPGIWDGITLSVGKDESQSPMFFDFVIAPGANISNISFAQNGASGISLDVNGNLVLQTLLGSIALTDPIAWQGPATPPATPSGITSNFTLGGNTVGLAAAGYDAGETLYIRISLSTAQNINWLCSGTGGTNLLRWSTFLNTTNSGTFFPHIYPRIEDLYITKSTVASKDNNVYMAISTGMQTYFPPTTGPVTGGTLSFSSRNIVVAKLNSARIPQWFSYLGTDGEDLARAIAVCELTSPAPGAVDGDVYVAGIAVGASYPSTLSSPPPPAAGGYLRANYQTNTAAAQDIYIARLDGTWGTFTTNKFQAYFGADPLMAGASTAMSPEQVQDMVIDNRGYVYIGGRVPCAVNGSYGGFPETQAGYPTAFYKPFSTSIDGKSHGFLAVLAPDNKITYSGRIGGMGYDGVTGLSLVANDRLVVTGFTNSDWHNYCGQAIGPGNGNLVACPVYSSANSMFPLSNSYANAVANSFPLVGEAGSYTRGRQGGYDAFLVSFWTTQMQLIWSTMLGGTDDEITDGLRLTYGTVSGDLTGSAYPGATADIRNALITDGADLLLVGCTQSLSGFPLVSAAQSTFGGGSWDAFATKIRYTPNATFSLRWSTYLGGDLDEFGTGAGASNGKAFIAGRVQQPYNQTTATFPAQNSSLWYYDASFNSGTPAPSSGIKKEDGFFAMYDASTGGKQHASYIGGQDGDMIRTMVVRRDLQNKDHVMVGGYTNTCGNFPLKDFNTSSGLDFYCSSKYGGLTPGTQVNSGYTGFVTDLHLAGNFLQGETLGVNDDGQSSLSTEMGTLYPNPATDYIVFRPVFDVQIRSLSLMTLLGQEVVSLSPETDATETRISTTGLPAGVYLLRITDSNGNISHLRFQLR